MEARISLKLFFSRFARTLRHGAPGVLYSDHFSFFSPLFSATKFVKTVQKQLELFPSMTITRGRRAPIP